MKTKNLTPFLVGTITTSRTPPQPEMVVIVRAKFILKPGQAVSPVEGPDPFPQGALTGDLFRDQDDDEVGDCVYASDFAAFKPHADLLLRGTCYPPQGNAAECLVRFGVGDWSKVLRVSGPRIWLDGAFGPTLSAPLPFTQMALDYTNGFGGPGFDQNPVGKGYKTNNAPAIEYPMHPIRSKSDKPEPAGFGPISPYWPQRRAKMGNKYGNDYQKKFAPYFAEDFDWTFFNAAPADQQLPGYLQGDEALLFQNMHPSADSFLAELPGLRIRVFVNDVQGRFREVGMNLDTLLADLDGETLTVTWRGLEPVAEDDLADVKTVLCASERMAEPPLPEEHYRAILDKFEQDPLGIQEKTEEFKRIEAEADAAAQGPAGPRLVKTPTQDGGDAATAPLDPLTALIQERMADLSEEHRIRIRDAVAKLAAAAKPHADVLQILQDALSKLADKTAPMPPHANQQKQALRSIAEAVARLKKTAVEKGATGDKFAELDAAIPQPKPAVEPGPGRDLSEQDLTGRDLSGMDLSLANLDDAILTGANLSNAKLVGASLKCAVLFEANLAGADLTDANLTMAALQSCKAEGAIFKGATLDNASFEHADLAGANLQAAKGKAVHFSHTNMTGIVASGAYFQQCVVEKAVLDQADLSHSSLIRCLFAEASLKEANLERATLTKTSFAEADASRAKFTEVRAEGGIFLKTVLEGADFGLAVLCGAFFNEAKAKQARFWGANLKEARFYRTCLDDAELNEANLFGADLRKSSLAKTRFHRANLYGANLSKTKTESADFSRANLKRSTLEDP